ncbi:HMA2 domain-containing protein [Helicobacter turcicus]|uniref:Uncharacterized protein n=1 Tax=Helicobacter turcicus TaxID=2867412 RepID=A0ABS7JPT0_9HELI|nr:hypothetical protein [Helicobacter turcicus]MBX7491416.1 hypothetical protein [Helicobacter turcicus]MBX7546283.1 hypothetical protein [Helicobacter turcicus]
MQENKAELINTLKDLEIKSSDLQLLRDYFSIVHHTKGRIRLRASLKLKAVAQEKKINPKALLEVLERIPLIFSIKFNPLIGSLTIHYDSNVLNPKLWEDCINGESLEEIAEIINKSLRNIV